MSTYHTTTAKYQGNYRISTLLSWRACVRALEDALGSYTSVVCLHSCSVVSFCCSFLLGLSNILTFNTPSARCYYFFLLTKGIPSHLAIDSLTHQKFGYAKPSWNSCCTHDISPSLSPSFGLFFSFSFFASVSIPFFSIHDFLTTRKRKFALSISSLQFQGLQLPPN